VKMWSIVFVVDKETRNLVFSVCLCCG